MGIWRRVFDILDLSGNFNNYSSVQVLSLGLFLRTTVKKKKRGV